MRDFAYVPARTLAEAASILNEKGDRARVLAGGTDIIVQVREDRRDLDALVDVKGIPELDQIAYDPAKGLDLGAAVPCYRIYGNEAVAKAYPGLIDAASMIGGIQIQGRASVGGNLCNASPAADAICPLIVYSATARIYGPNGERRIPVEQFCTAPGRTALQRGEFLVSLHLPAPKANSNAFYLRFIPRNEMDIAVVGAGAYVTLDAAGNRFVSARVALAAVAPTPLFLPEIGEFLAGKETSEDVIHQAGEMARSAAKPISDMRGTADHRRQLSAVLTRRALNGAIKRVREA